jgi:hypothetical protein
MEELQKARQHAPHVRHHEMQVGRHRAERMHLHAEAPRRDRKRVDEELRDRRVGAKEQVPTLSATGEQIGGAGTISRGWLIAALCVQTPCRALRVMISKTYPPPGLADSIFAMAPPSSLGAAVNRSRAQPQRRSSSQRGSGQLESGRRRSESGRLVNLSWVVVGSSLRGQPESGRPFAVNLSRVV